MAHDSRHEVVLSLLPAGPRERRLAVWVVAASMVVFIAAVPFAKVPLAKVPAFLPFYQSALSINDAITALLLFGQARAARSRPLLLLACGYVFTAVMTLLHLLTYPDVFAPTGLLGSGTQTTAWMYMFWHAGFPLVVVAYAFMRHDREAKVDPRHMLAGTVAAAALAAALAVFATTGHDLLPVLLREHRYTGVYPAVSAFVWIMAIAGAASLWLRSRRTVLDVWLMVVMCAWIFDVALGAVLNGGRYDLGFYVGRVYGLLAASFVLMVLLFEHSVLHAQLLRAREREREQAAALVAAAAEAAARREHESARNLLETVVRQMPGGIVIADASGRIILANEWAREVLGADLLDGRHGLWIETSEHPEGRPLAAGEHPLARALAGVPVSNTELIVRRESAGRLVLSANAAPVRDAAGISMGAVVAFSDITARKQAEADRRRLLDDAQRAREDAEHANRAKDEFLAMLGHELRNPLAPIRTALQLIRMRGETAFEKERVIIERQVAQLVHLVNDLLDVSRITSGKIELQCEPCDLHEVAAKAIEMASPIIEQRRHHFSVDLQEGVRLDCDSVRLAQVMSNLLINAAKYTQPGGEIVLAGSQQGKQVEISVRDNGPGIGPALLEQLFKPFVQGARHERRAEGLGLGLAIARSLVSLHGGTISAHSAGPGEGSEFVIRLPATTSVPASPRRVADAPQAPARHAARVLLVDDNADAAVMLALALRSAGIRVDVAHDGPQALELAAVTDYDVALLDLGLPVMDGYELARRLRDARRSRSPVVIAITGYGEHADRLRTMEAGFIAHFVKPVDVEEVVGVIGEVEAAMGLNEGAEHCPRK